MASVTAARDRAEELFETLQKKARDLLEAEEGLTQTARELLESKRLQPQEVRRKLEELLGRIKANKVWGRLFGSDTVVALGDYRDELERRVEDSVQRVLEALRIASQQDVERLGKQVTSLNKKIAELNKKLGDNKQ